MANPLSYAFWAGDNNENMTLEQLRRRQAVAAALAGQKRNFPKNVGEGLTYLGESLGERMEANRLREAEAAFDAKYGAKANAMAPPQWGTGAPTGGAAPVAPSPSVMPNNLPLGAGMPTAGAVTPPPTAPPPAPGTAEAPASEDAKTRIALALLRDDAPGGAQANPMVSDQAAGGPASDPTTLARRRGIAGIETGGRSDPYQTVGVETRGDRPYGKYQVMGRNIPSWSQAALGHTLTPREFLADRYAQDRIFDHRFGQYAAKYGDEGAARAWFAGEGGMNNPNARDRLGTRVGDYGSRFVASLGGDGGDGGGGQRPIRVAARGDTATDAPSLLVPSPPVSDEENEETPTDIRPMPVRTQLAQAPRSVIPGSAPTVSSDMFSPNPMNAPAASAVRPGARPSELPIPPYRPQVMPDPGPPPAEPGPIPYSPRQRDAIDLLNDRNAPEWVKERAKRAFDLEEKFRTELQTRAQEAYKNRREAHEKAVLEKQKFDREEDIRNVEELTKWIALQKARPEAERADVDLKKAQVDLEDALYKTGVPRQQAEREAALRIQQAERTLAKPDTVGAGGTQFERPYTPGGGPQQPYAVPPGLPQPKEESLTEPQQKGVQMVIRVTPDLDAVERELRYGKVMTLPQEAWRDLPLIGNMTISDEYRRARDALGNWGSAFLTHVSGAAVSPSEALRNLPAFVPRAGDTDQELIDKARRRRSFTNAVETTVGRAGLDAIKKELGGANADYLFKKANEMEPLPQGQVKSPADAKLLPPGRRFILPDGSVGTVPRSR